MREKIQALFLKMGYEVRKYTDPFEVQKRLLSNVQSPVIFDAGAYHGYVSTHYKKLFPSAQIYAFEPFPESFSVLQNRTQNSQDIHAINVALSDKTGSAEFRVNASSAANSLFATDPAAFAKWGGQQMKTSQTIAVKTMTVDDFVRENNIARIDLLKMDVQGAEYFVLEGARQILSGGHVGVIYTEIITETAYAGQKPLHEILSLLNEFGFELYNFYNIYPAKSKMKQMDAIFVRR